MSLRVAGLMASCSRNLGVRTSITSPRQISLHTNSLCIGRSRFLQNESSKLLMQYKRFSQFKRHSHQTHRETQQTQRDASLSAEWNILSMLEANVSANTYIEQLVNTSLRNDQKNEIISQLWPHIRDFVEQWLRNVSDVYLNEIFKKCKISDFEFCLGKSSPSCTVKVHERNDTRPEAVVDLNVSDFCIDAAKFKLAGISWGLKNIKLQATTQLILTSNAKTITLKVVVDGVKVDFDEGDASLGLQYALPPIIRFLLPFVFTVVLRNADATHNLTIEKSDPFALLDVVMPELPNYCVQASETLSTNELIQRENLLCSSIVLSVCISPNILLSPRYMSSDPFTVFTSTKRKFDKERDNTGIDNTGVETENTDMDSDKRFKKTTMAKAVLEARGESGVIKSDSYEREIERFVVAALTPDPINFGVYKPTKYFTGRKNELKQLEECLRASNSSVVVSGLGGIGKTQLVRKFICEKGSIYENVICIHAENNESIFRSFKALATRMLGAQRVQTIRTSSLKELKPLIEEVLDKLCQKNTLLIYDDVVTIESINFLLPLRPSGKRPNVVIISRIQEFDDGFNVIQLKQWTISEAKEYVSKVLDTTNTNDSNREIDLLVEKLHYFPLALTQCTAYIKCQRERKDFSISDYIFKIDTKMLDAIQKHAINQGLDS